MDLGEWRAEINTTEIDRFIVEKKNTMHQGRSEGSV